MRKITLTIITTIMTCMLFVACAKTDSPSTKENTPLDNVASSNDSIMRAVGEIKEINTNDKDDYIVLDVNGKDVKFYLDNKTEKASLKVGENVEVLYAGISSAPKDEYAASEITGSYSEDKEDTTSAPVNNTKIETRELSTKQNKE